MKVVARGLVGLVGLSALLGAVMYWINPQAVAAKFGLVAQGTLGLSSLRADNAGLFAGIGIFAIASAWRADRQLLLAPVVLISLALSGRLLNAALQGLPPETVPPMVVEAISLTVFLFGRRTWASGRS